LIAVHSSHFVAPRDAGAAHRERHAREFARPRHDIAAAPEGNLAVEGDFTGPLRPGSRPGDKTGHGQQAGRHPHRVHSSFSRMIGMRDPWKDFLATTPARHGLRYTTT